MTPQTEDDKQKSDTAKREEEILKFWQENKIFEKSLEQTKGQSEFIFYDGPPFATGVPHYGHILAGTLKDVMPRYQTMKGKHVRRRWGWDCHGLPIENIVEKEFGLGSKKDIEEFGIEQFNLKAREKVFTYAHEWMKQVPRLGRWVDMEHSYKTMDSTYTESVWRVFKTLFDKGLAYEGYKSMHICPRCETTLSNFEVGQGYKDITDISVTVKFELVDFAVENFSQVLGNNPQTVEKTSAGSVYVLAWTTTPWTLPGNVALAVNPEIDYVQNEDNLIFAKSRLESIPGVSRSIKKQFKGSELIGKKYKPVFDYFQNKPLKNYKGQELKEDTGWRIYGADFVTTEDGTGIVHIAPAFGEDDMNLGKEKNLPFIQHVTMSGRFTSEVTDWAGEPVKPKEDHTKIDVEILKYLAEKKLLFAKEKYTHSYPHCWRCQTPLLNYATSSWFVDVPKIRENLIKNNQGINWVPEHIKDGRFGNWLEGAREWAISRQRYWGAPLPVWKCDKCKKIEAFGSVSELGEHLPKTKNDYIIMRHGEADSNVGEYLNGNPSKENNLTAQGQEKVKLSAEELKKQRITKIIASDIPRAQQTAKILAGILDIPEVEIIFEPKLREINFGEYEGKGVGEYQAFAPNYKDRFTKSLPGGENLNEIRQRMASVVVGLEQKFSNEKILIISHETPLWLLQSAASGQISQESVAQKEKGEMLLQTAEWLELEWQNLPRNQDFELDLHRPYIDNIKPSCVCGGEMRRIPDLFDCWFESGSMPYGQMHYPFENKEVFDPAQKLGFPADFIAEGLDQTRGWFYSMLVLSTALFGQTSYKNVIVNGIILAENGEKMSKSLKNYPDPMIVVDKFGADALRFYLMSSPVVRAEDLNFSEKGLGELYRRVIMRLTNVVSFFEMYVGAGELVEDKPNSANILDRWIIARLNELMVEVGKNLDAYELDRAAHVIDNFIDDLSNWYTRRSRDRFKSEDAVDRQAAIVTTQFVLRELTKVMAPFTPFIAEEIYQKLKNAHDPESVHLCVWPEAGMLDEKLISEMAATRKLVELGLAARMEAGIKVRQPLAKLKIKTQLESGYLELIADEMNVKQVVVDLKIKNEVELDVDLTAELREEGELRELLRQIQDLRKKAGLSPTDQIKLQIGGSGEVKNLIDKYSSSIQKDTKLSEIIWVGEEKEMKIGS